jgi:hypothetical protein
VSNQLPAFLDGARLRIKIDGKVFAFCEALSFSDNMASQLTMGIGSYSPHTNEPLIYSAQASLRVLRYTTSSFGPDADSENGKFVYNSAKSISSVSGAKGFQADRASDGNSMMFLNTFSPVKMLLESTFDIEVQTRANMKDNQGKANFKTTYIMKDCLITDLSIRFNVGALVSEDVSILCRYIIDQDERIVKTV